MINHCIYEVNQKVGEKYRGHFLLINKRKFFISYVGMTLRQF